jgi:hypothetical protein
MAELVVELVGGGVAQTRMMSLRMARKRILMGMLRSMVGVVNKWVSIIVKIRECL